MDFPNKLRKYFDSPIHVLIFLSQFINLAIFLFLSVFVLGHLFGAETEEMDPLSLTEVLGLICFPAGVMIGILISFWKRKLGSAIVLLSVIGFSLIIAIPSASYSLIPILGIISIANLTLFYFHLEQNHENI